MNNAAVDRGLFETLLSIPLGVYPEVELLDHMVIPFLVFFTFLLTVHRGLSAAFEQEDLLCTGPEKCMACSKAQ